MSTTDQDLHQTPPETPAAAPAIPEDYEDLKRFREEYSGTLEALRPYWNDYIAPIIEDEGEREFIKSARETRKRYLEAQEPQLDPGLAKVRDEFRTELAPVVEYIQSERKAREEREKADKEAAQQANLAYAQRLATERPDLVEENYAGMHMLASLATRDNISLEESWKRYGSRIGGPRPKREEPPRSLRGGEARPGVPGESSEPPIRSARDLQKRLVKNLGSKG